MDVFRFSIGVLFLLFGLILFVIQFREGVFSRKEKVNVGDIRMFFAGVSGVSGGGYLIFTSF